MCLVLKTQGIPQMQSWEGNYSMCSYQERGKTSNQQRTIFNELVRPEQSKPKASRGRMKSHTENQMSAQENTEDIYPSVSQFFDTPLCTGLHKFL